MLSQTSKKAKFKTWLNSTRTAAKAIGVWPLTIGVAAASGADRRFTPGNEDKFTGGSTEMIQAIADADLHDTNVLWDQHGSGGVAAGTHAQHLLARCPYRGRFNAVSYTIYSTIC